MSTFAGEGEQTVKNTRKSGDIPAILSQTIAVIDAIDAKMGAAENSFAEDQIAALNTIKRIAFNAAADAWPGWKAGAPPRTPDELAAAKSLARRSQAIVEQLDLDPMQRGNAVWLIGALDLAQGDAGQAHAAFKAAGAHYERAASPEMRQLAEGYAAIAMGRGGDSAFEAATGALTALASEDAAACREQLLTAHNLFAPRDQARA